MSDGVNLNDFLIPQLDRAVMGVRDRKQEKG
jgi:hypothetical protein